MKVCFVFLLVQQTHVWLSCMRNFMFPVGGGDLALQPFHFILRNMKFMSQLFLNPHLVKQQVRSSSAEDQQCFMKYPAQLNLTLIQTSGTVYYFCRNKVFIVCWGKTCISVSNDGNLNQTVTCRHCLLLIVCICLE